MLFYTRNSVTVDEDFARFGDKSYPVDKIMSLAVRKVQPYGLEGFWVSLILVVITAVAGIGSLVDAQPGSTITPGALLLACSIGFAGLTYWQYRRAQLVEFYVVIELASRLIQEQRMADERDADMLRDAIEAAISLRTRSAP